MYTHTKSNTVLFLMLGFLFGFGAITRGFPQGHLVIVGGGLEDNNHRVFDPLIELAGGKEKASFAVIPSSSGVPVQSYVSFRNTLISWGILPNHIHLIPIAMVDDDSTGHVDESEWKYNGDDPELAGIVRSCSAVWFTGGDQSRTVKTLIRPDGSRTHVLEAVWEVYRSGGVVGGTSAGAAIMSETMIGGGNSLAALSHGIVTEYMGDDFPEGMGLLLMKGLGFFPLGTVDQHFGARTRIGRLVTALLDSTFGAYTGFGIDENTALIYSDGQKKLKVAGAAGITLVNTTEAMISYIQGLPCIENLSVSYLEDGDSYDGTTGIITPAEGKKPLRGNEYYYITNPGQAGIMSGNSATFRDLLAIHLMDNKGTDTVRNVSLDNKEHGFLVTLIKTPQSEGFYAEQPYSEEHYTVVNVRMDIMPVQIAITPLKE